MPWFVNKAESFCLGLLRRKSRGVDLSSVSEVINYDVPAFAKTYIHGWGGTARARREGKDIRVLKGGQLCKFKKLPSLIGGG